MRAIYSYHMWICQRHKPENRKFLDQFSNDYRTKHKLDFGLFAMPGVVISSSLKAVFTDPVVNQNESSDDADGKIFRLR